MNINTFFNFTHKDKTKPLSDEYNSLQRHKDQENKIQEIANAEIDRTEINRTNHSANELNKIFPFDLSSKNLYSDLSSLSFSKKVMLAASGILGLAGLTYLGYSLSKTNSNDILNNPQYSKSDAIRKFKKKFANTSQLNSSNSSSEINSSNTHSFANFSTDQKTNTTNNNSENTVITVNEKSSFTAVKKALADMGYYTYLTAVGTLNLFGGYKFLKVGTRRSWMPQITLAVDASAGFYELLSRNPPKGTLSSKNHNTDNQK